MPETLPEMRRLTDDFYQFRAETNSRLATLEKNAAVESVHRENVEKRLTGIEDNTKWVIRILVGAFLSAVVAFALNGGFTIG